jgi:poly-gamma-glutamate synthesis protein (capsule biosynthesis protein)
MHPRNIECLGTAGIDCCLLANNHVLDWGFSGLEETLSTLEQAKIHVAGAGRTLSEARRPVLLEVPERGAVAILACGSETSGMPREWSASETRPGVNVIDELDLDAATAILAGVRQLHSDRTTIVVSIHWGPNWGYAISLEQRRLAHALVDDGADVVFGHSSHHVKAIEVYRSRPILYGAGDLITDYEGISGYEEFRGDLGLLYFLKIDPLTGELAEMQMVPTRMERFQLIRPSPPDVQWLIQTLNREGESFGTSVTWENGCLNLQWPH